MTLLRLERTGLTLQPILSTEELLVIKEIA
jgi:hypothetical protein